MTAMEWEAGSASYIIQKSGDAKNVGGKREGESPLQGSIFHLCALAPSVSASSAACPAPDAFAPCFRP